MSDKSELHILPSWEGASTNQHIQREQSSLPTIGFEYKGYRELNILQMYKELTEQ